MTKEEIKKAASDYKDEIVNSNKANGFTKNVPTYTEVEIAFSSGASWAQETIIKKCMLTSNDNPSIDEQRIVSFIDDFIRANSKSPTIEDFLMWQKRNVIEKACEWFKHHMNDKWVYNDKEYEGPLTVAFRRAMEQ